MKRFISINVRSIVMYSIMVSMAIGIEISAIISGNAMMFLLPLVIVWIIVAGFFGLFSRFKISDTSLEISGDFLVENRGKIQKKHKIDFSEVVDYKKEILPSGVDSYFNPIKLSYNTRHQYLNMYGYSKINCITFYLKDGSKQCLIINRYSKNQIVQLLILLDKYIRKTINDDVVLVNRTDNRLKNNGVSIERVKYPRYLKILFIIYIVTFIVFVIHSGMLGGDAHNGFISGSDYYVSSHGRDTLVTYDDWILNYYFGIAMFISAGLLFPSAIYFHFKHWKNNR